MVHLLQHFEESDWLTWLTVAAMVVVMAVFALISYGYYYLRYQLNLLLTSHYHYSAIKTHYLDIDENLSYAVGDYERQWLI